jgi:SulP family sulfate permease
VRAPTAEGPNGSQFSEATRMLKTQVRQEIQPRRLLSTLAAGLVTGIIEVTESTAFAVLIFSGILAAYVPRGIGLMLAADMVIITLTAIFSSLPGVVAGLEDTVVAIIALVSFTIVNRLPASTTAEGKFVTVVVAIGLSSLLTGGLFLSLGQFKLGNLIRFIPYPVIGGFLAGTGLLLAFGALSVMTGTEVNLFRLQSIMQPSQYMKWLPGLLFAVFLLLTSRRFKHVLVFPGTLLAGIVAFYILLGLTNTSIGTATQQGWLLGSLPANATGLWQPLRLSDLAQVNWYAIIGQTVSLFVIAVVSVITLLLNATSLELVTGQSVDLNRELKAAGIANLVTGLGGGMVGVQALDHTTLPYKMGARSRLVAFIVAALCGLTFLVGSSLLSYFPNPILGGLLLFLGLDFLATWVYDAWFKLPITDYFIMIVILVVINTLGFLEGVSLGVVLAVILFVVNYSRINVVKHVLNGATFHSNVNRPRLHQQMLREKGDCLYILKLQGLIFFGTAQKLVDLVRQRIDNPSLATVRFLVLDFRLVNGFDSSALLGFTKIGQLTEMHGITLVFSNLSPGLQRKIKRELHQEGKISSLQFFFDLDHAVEWCEDQIVAALRRGKLTERPPTLMEQLVNSLPSPDMASKLMSCFEEKKAEKGERIIRQGQDSVGLYFIERGQVTVQLEDPDGKTTRLRTMQAGTVVGELSTYLGGKTTASVIADEPCTLFHLTAEKLKDMEKNSPDIAAAFHSFIIGILSERLIDTTATLQTLLG